MANVITTAAVLDASQITLMDGDVYTSGEAYLKVDQFAYKPAPIMGASEDFTFYGDIADATTPLTDGTDPDSVALADSKITVSPKEYGAVVTTTKLSNLTTGGKADRGAGITVGRNMGNTLDRLGCLALDAATNVEDKTGSVLDRATLRLVVRDLEAAKIPKMMDDLYVLIAHPNVLHDIKDDYMDIVQYTDGDAALRGAMGMIEGCLVISDANCTNAAGVYNSYVLGYNALIRGTSVTPEMTITGPFDKLGRTLNIGWTGTFEYKILDANAVTLIKNTPTA